jgi:uncharacterized protein
VTTTLPIRLTIGDDELEASLEFLDEAEQALPTLPELLEYLRDTEGLVGIDESAVESLVIEAEAGDGAGPEVIARGSEAQVGKDAEIRWEGEFFESVSLERPDGSIDFYHRTKTSVAADDLIATILPPGPGTEGTTVSGEAIPARAGREWKPRLDSTVRWEDENSLVAAVGGRVEYANEKLSISELLQVESVDYASSSVEFDGAVEVRGDVQEGFSVEAKGSVTIKGFVEAAPIRAGGSLVVQSGIIGKARGEIESGGDMEFATARELKIRCFGQLLTHGELLFCDATVKGTVTASAHRVIGGSWTVGGSLYCEELGSESETPTVIRVGVDSELERQQAAISEEREELQAELEKRSEQLEKLRASRQSSEKGRIAMEKIELYVQQVQLRESELAKADADLRRRIKKTRREGSIWVAKTLYPGVTITVGGHPKTLEITKPVRGPLKIGYERGRQIPVISFDHTKNT